MNDDTSVDQELPPEETEDEFLRAAKKRFDQASESMAEHAKVAIEDLRFRAGQQWPDDIKTQRDIEQRPCLTINYLPQHLNQVLNDERQNRKAIEVSPIDDVATPETAEILQGMIRHIEDASNADIAEDRAFDGAASHGLGYQRIITRYANPHSFQQEIAFKSIRDPMSVKFDPSSSEPDGSDASWAQIEEVMTKAEFKAQYPDKKLSKMEDWTSLGGEVGDWVTKEGCRIAEEFIKTFKKTKIYQLSNGKVLEEKNMPKPPATLPEGLTVLQTRDTVLPAIKWRKFNGVEILEETDWAGRWIPIVPTYGVEIFVNGKRILEGVIRHAKDPQRMLNYWESAKTEVIALAPRAPWVGAAGQFEDFEDKWQTANVKSHAFLEYNMVDINGTPAPPPTRNTYEPPVQAITQASVASVEHIKGTTGIYDASLGNKSNEQSGIAIERRTTQVQTSNFHFSDNQARSRRHMGRILIDLIPKIYDTAQATRIIKPDGTPEIVVINQLFKQKGSGKEMIYDLDLGSYDVTISSGPNFQTKRQEAAHSMIDLTKAFPQIFPVAGDLMVKNMDWPGANEIAERMKKMLPPQLQDQPGQEDIPPEIQQAMQTLRIQNQQLTQKLTEAAQIIESKKVELASRERIEMARMKNDLAMEVMKHDAAHAMTAFKEEIGFIKEKLRQIPGPEQLNPGNSPQNPGNPNSPPPAAGGQAA